MSHTLTRADLKQSAGLEHWYRHLLDRRVLFNDGIKHVADTRDAYWLVHEIALARMHVPAAHFEPFQLWRLTVRPNQFATLDCSEGNGNTVHSKPMAQTDFPLALIELYLSKDTVLLPSEY